ncbi:hypothetical protein Tco_0997203 [Tanacetum coccineum]
MLYDSLVQFEPRVLASKAKKDSKNHDPLAFIAHSNASSSQYHANSSYSPQPYYVTHPSSVVDYEEEYQGELQGDSQEVKLTTAMIRNQAMIQDGRVDIQTKNAGYDGNGNKNAGRQSTNQMFNAGNGNDDNNQIIQRVLRTESTLGKENAQCYNCNEKGHYAQTMEELTTIVMLTARIQLVDGNAEIVPLYDVKAVSEVNASSKVHEQIRYEKRKTIIQTSDDDQIDSNIIFDDLYVENNGGTSDHDSNDHDEYHKIQMLAYDVQREAENQKRLNNELKKQKILLQKELETSGSGYKNPERLKKAIAAQPKMYYGEKLHSAKLVIDSPDSEETLEYAEKSRLKMRNKMVQINYANLNALYKTFVPQQDFSMEQTYFSIPSTSTNGSESKVVTSDLPIPKMPKESKLLKMFDTLGMAINDLRTMIDNTLLEDQQRRWMSDSQNSLKEFYKTDVILMAASLSKNLKELKEELIVEVQEMLNIFESMEQKVDQKSSKENIIQNEIDRLLEVSLTSEIRDCVLLSVEKQKNELLKMNL